MKIVVIGSGGAGVTAAVEARRNNVNADVTIVDSNPHVGYAPCAFPYVISKDISSFDSIKEFSESFVSSQGVKLMLGKKATHIDRANKIVELDDGSKLSYDSLILATGSRSFVPPINRINSVKFHVLKTFDDAKAIYDEADTLLKSGKKKAVIIGAGFIGVETAHALKKRGFDVVVLEVAPYVLPTVLDEDFADKIKDELVKEGIEVHCSVKIKEVSQNNIVTDNGLFNFDMLILVTGVRANVDLAKDAGLSVNRGIVVDETMRTSDMDIYACGDCIELKHLILGTTMPSQLATTALRSGMVAGHNASVKDELSKIIFKGVLNTGVSKIGGLIVASTGLNEFFAKKNGMKYVKAVLDTTTKEHYAPKKYPLHIKLLVDYSKHIIGAQIIGGEDVVPRIDLVAMAIKEKIPITEFLLMEHAYSPLTSPVREPLSLAAEICVKKLGALKDWSKK